MLMTSGLRSFQHAKRILNDCIRFGLFFLISRSHISCEQFLSILVLNNDS